MQTLYQQQYQNDVYVFKINRISFPVSVVYKTHLFLCGESMSFKLTDMERGGKRLSICVKDEIKA